MFLTLAAIDMAADISVLGQSSDHCQPSTITNVVPSCPSITNWGAIDASSFCVDQGSDPTMPQLTEGPAADGGSVTTTTTTTASDCSTTTTSSTSPITYNFSGLQYNPAPPTKSSRPGSYQSDCYVTLTSSDTNDCPSPDNIDYGNITWNVVDTNVTTIDWDPAKSASAIASALGYVNSAANAGGCQAAGPSFSGKITASWNQTCCNSTNGPYKHSNVTGTINVTVGSISCPIPGCSIPLPPPINDYAQIGLTGSFSASGIISGVVGVAQPCQTAPICVNLGLTTTIGVTGGVVLNTPGGYASCGATVSGSCSASMSTTGESPNCNLSGNLGALMVSAQVSLHIVGFCKSFSGSGPVWKGISIGPYPTSCMCFTQP
jgi:hypothetical protein